MINPNAAGIDVHSDQMWVCVPADRAELNVRQFGAYTEDLYAIADFLSDCRITSVAMESTGVYWIPLYQVLEERGFTVCLTNARHLKNIAGRPKTDNLDCQWIQRLHSYGFLRPSFRPEMKFVAFGRSSVTAGPLSMKQVGTFSICRRPLTR